MGGRVTWLVAAALMAAMLGALAVEAWVTRAALQDQIERHDRDAAAALARVLGHLHEQPAAVQALAAAAFEGEPYRLLRLQAGAAAPLFDHQRTALRSRAPAWFVSLLPVAAAPATATVPQSGREFATLTLESSPAAEQDALWDALGNALFGLMSLVLAVAVLAVWIGRAWQRTLRAAAQQARALEAGRFIQTPEPRWPELRDLTRSLNATVARLREVYAAQAERVTRLQRQAQLDAVTGVSVRQPFMGQLQHQLAEPGGPGSALLLLRLLQLEALNLRLGHEPTDRLLRGVGDILLTYVDRVPGTFAGRLKGSDFALCLPVPGVALETAESLRAALSASPALRMGGAELAIGGVDGLVDTTVSAALAAADAALARAEAGARVVVDPHGAREAEAVGARAWREQIASALSEGRTRLAEFSVVDRTGQLIHLECPLRVQMRPGGEFDTAERWLALARRSRLLPQADLTALQLALKAIAEDGRPRAVRVALSSLAAEGFVAAASWRLQAAPTAAQRLSIECVEGLRPAQLGRLADAATAWRRWGVRLGIEHGGAAAQALPRLREAGIDYVKVDARHVRGAATDAAVRDYAQSLVALIHGLGLTALADGVDDAADLAALWPLGFDGVTGSAVTTL